MTGILALGLHLYYSNKWKKGQGGGTKLVEKQRPPWRCSHEAQNKENNEGCEMGDGEPSQIFYKGSGPLRARRKEWEVSLSWHGFFVLREATNTMNPAFENRACAISGFFLNLSYCVALCHSQTMSPRVESANVAPKISQLIFVAFSFLSRLFCTISVDVTLVFLSFFFLFFFSCRIT